jgi:hypothetical protein
MEVTPHVFREVQMDNIRNHQIGGETDGMSKEQAQELGFMATEQVVELIHDMEAPKPEPKPLTSRQKNENARRHVAEHLKRVNKQVIDPHYG